MTAQTIFGIVMALLLVAMLALVEGMWGTSVGGGVTFIPSTQIRVWLDPETGCEYFAASGTPRFGADGKQICSVEGVSRP